MVKMELAVLGLHIQWDTAGCDEKTFLHNAF